MIEGGFQPTSKMKRGTTLRFAQAFADYRLRGHLQHLILHVTNHCNFRCQHCFVDFAPKRDLDLEDYLQLAEEAGRVFWLDVAGGEPLLRKDLVEIVSAFDAEVIHVHTNGAFEERTVEVATELRKRTDAQLGFALSLDGLRETHDRIRGHAGNYDAVWEVFERLQAIEGVSVYINAVLTNSNEAEILELMEEVWDRHPDFHAVTLLRGQTIDETTELPSMKRLHELGPSILEIVDRYADDGSSLLRRFSKNYHRYVWNVSLKTLEEERQVIPCLAGSASMVVWGDGQVGSCELLPTIGDLRTAPWSEIRGSKALADQRASIRRKECHCTHNCALFDSVMYRPTALPQLLHQPVR